MNWNYVTEGILTSSVTQKESSTLGVIRNVYSKCEYRETGVESQDGIRCDLFPHRRQQDQIEFERNENYACK